MTMQNKTFETYLLLLGMSKKSVISMSRTANRFLQWIEKENIMIEHTRQADILSYYERLKATGSSKRTLAGENNAIKHYYHYLADQNRITANPCSAIKIKGIKRKTVYNTFTKKELDEMYQGYKPATATEKRNKVILSLLIYQGMRTEEISKLEIQHIKLRDGKIEIESSRKYNGREIKLESFQIFDLLDYINETRKELLAHSNKTTTQLFISAGKSQENKNIFNELLKQLKKQNPSIENLKQLRISVIVHWLKIYNLRKVQYLCGHRYVSSTERYKLNNIDDLREEVNKYHPIL